MADLKFYVQRSDGAYISFEGMSEQTITDMLMAQGMTCTFIDETAFNAAVQSQQP